ncbi:MULTISPECIES: DUF551 domain-containing protein [Enterobacter]|uniref:DUF551 domain-containing protein n=1 Tax=Enterobacter TaxID=547 RepID=UPI00208E90B1|nr:MULTISPECIES: DUF551 domain-containing protein [Enterobacter]HCM9626365.1 DUF551 domain-containing protein [Enterobacter hormaechei subsp. hoffmannii]HCM9664448.1 DUF551 domain-containing protein [Enterobacter hormaechei subsp. hoffmannii]
MELSRDKVKEIINDDWLLMDDCEGNKNCDVVKELARIALASLEAEAVAYIRSAHNPDGFCFADGIHPTHRHQRLPLSTLQDGCYWKVTPLYTAPPAPVSVPDDVMAAMQKVARIRLDLNDFDGDKRGILDCLGDAEEALIEVVNRRAAMLQGAEPVTTANKLPDDFDFDRFNDVVWLEAVASNPHMHSPTTSTIAMVALELNKRLETGNSQVVPDGWVACSDRMPSIGVPVITCCGDVVQYATYAWDGKEWQDWYEEYDKLPANTFTHWHPRPAAPQQEGKNV